MTKTRRTFLKEGGMIASGLALMPSLAYSAKERLGRVKIMLMKLSNFNDNIVDDLLDMQVQKPGDRWHGGVQDIYELPNAHSTLHFIMHLASSYASPYSRYHLSDKLVHPLNLAIKCLLNVQHDDGTIDLHSTNFHSTPDTAFLVNYLSPIYVITKRLEKPELSSFVGLLGEFIQNSGKCLAVGGAHTANHRWVISSALARVNSFFPAKKYIDRIDEWFKEGIDLDPDGQYTEQSVAAYSPICDNMFLTMGRLLDREDLLDVARKNLEMSMYYIQPGGEVLTDASGRQDSAYTGYVSEYYYSYLYFAIKDKNPAFSAVCTLIENDMPEKAVFYLPYLLELPIFEETVPQPSKIPDDYFKRFEHSGVFRIRRGDADISIIENNPTFLSFMKGSAVMQSIRVGAAFFGRRGQFIPEKTEFDGKEIVLSKYKKHGYFQPFPEDKIPGDGIYEKMLREERELSEAQEMDYKVSITENNGKVSLAVEITGTEYVPVSIELSFREGGELTGVTTDKNQQNSYFLENGEGKYRVGNDTIKFGPGANSHKWATMRGMLNKQPGNSVYITGYTPFKHTIELS